MLTATIYTTDTPNANGIVYSAKVLQDAIVKFNRAGGLATLEDTPPQYAIVDMDKIAAQATLSFDGKRVTASLEMLDTPHGKIVDQLLDHNLLGVVPIDRSEMGFDNVAHNLHISKLVFTNKNYIRKPSDLHIIQNWVTGNRINDMFKLVDSDK